jgi:membrane protease YdiL (CAAX protease family)
MASALSHLLVAYLVLVWPWAGRSRYRRIQKELRAGIPGARVRVYREWIKRQAAITASVVLISLFGHIPTKALGLVMPSSWEQTLKTLSILSVAMLVSIVRFRYGAEKQFNRLKGMVGALLPISNAERWWFAAVSIGAGISEELVFRGFLLYYLWTWLPRLNSWERIIISSLVFGFCHLYQSWRGILGTGALGVCFALLYVGSGSLLVPIVIHVVIDVRMLTVLNPRRVQILEKADEAGCA